MKYNYYKIFKDSSKVILYYRENESGMEFFHPENHEWRTSAWKSIGDYQDNRGYQQGFQHKKCTLQEIKSLILTKKLMK